MIEIEALTNHLWQSTVFGAVAGLLTLLLRKSHARPRYWVWLAASVKFLVPFAVLVSLGSHFGWRETRLPASAPLAIERFGPMFTPAISAPITAVKPHPISFVPILLWALWCCGCAAVLFAWCVRWRRTAGIIRAAEPLTAGREVETLKRLQAPIEIVSSNARFEPGVFGILRPILLWPAGISERLADAQIEAILAHEVSHVRRRDNLVAALHTLVEAVFWFHPLVWWIGARLVAERETACDQDVLRLRSEPEVYAEGILKVCEYCLEAPLLCVSGVSGADLKKRIQAIMANRITHDLGWPRRLLLAIAAIAAIAAPIGIGLMNAPASEAQSQAVPRPAFEVASVKPGDPNNPQPFFRTPPGGRYIAANVTLRDLIENAYSVSDTRISGGPNWLGSDRFTVEAKAAAPFPPWPDGAKQVGLMLQSLLEDRFKLAVHWEKKDAPVYALVVARGGPKLKQADASESSGFGMERGRIRSMAVPLENLASNLSYLLGRPVIDKTGLSAKYDYTLIYVPEPGQAALGPPEAGPPPEPDGPSIFTALQEQLGLKLESQKGPVDILVIDHVEKPSEN